MPTLGKVGIVDKGNYSASATYNSGDFVTYNGSTFLAIKDGVKGIAPSDDKTNWKYLAKGFNEPAASGITVTDTHGIIDGSKGKKTFAQNLFYGIGSWIITKAVTNDTFVNKLTERLINNGTATLEGFALDARQGNPTVEGSLAKRISKLNEELNFTYPVKTLFCSANSDGSHRTNIQLLTENGVNYSLEFNSAGMQYGYNDSSGWHLLWSK